MWRLTDFFTNLYLTVKLRYLMFFKSTIFDNIINEIDKSNWSLTFNDEFNVGKLDRSKWITKSYFGLRYHDGNIINENKAPEEYYSDNCFEFTDTTIKQIIIDEPVEIHHIDWSGKDWGKFTIPYQRGHLDSSQSFEQKYGYFEIRSKITSEPGSWPAFWLASKQAWPPEIDVYEIFTGKNRNTFESNFHSLNKNGEHKSCVKIHHVKDVSKSFHIYAVEWNEDRFKIYYDNILVRIYSKPSVLNSFKYPMHLIINNGVDSGKNSNLDKSKFPTYHEIDYVRVYNSTNDS